MTTSCTPLNIYQLRIVLRGISPLIWRRVLVHSERPWRTCIPSCRSCLPGVTSICTVSISMAGSTAAVGHSTRGVRLHDLRLHRGERFRYVYDFGAYWECDIRLEALLPLSPTAVYPVCTGGKRAAPPEDCRGAWGYLERLDQHRLYPPLEAMGVVAEASARC